MVGGFWAGQLPLSVDWALASHWDRWTWHKSGIGSHPTAQMAKISNMKYAIKWECSYKSQNWALASHWDRFAWHKSPPSFTPRSQMEKISNIKENVGESIEKLQDWSSNTVGQVNMARSELFAQSSLLLASSHASQGPSDWCAENGNELKCSVQVKFVGTAWWLNGETLTEVQIQFKYKTHLAQYQVYLTKYQIYLAKYQIHSPKYQIHLPKYQTHPPQYQFSFAVQIQWMRPARIVISINVIDLLVLDSSLICWAMKIVLEWTLLIHCTANLINSVLCSCHSVSSQSQATNSASDGILSVNHWAWHWP